jgi:hypothetical protein
MLEKVSVTLFRKTSQIAESVLDVRRCDVEQFFPAGTCAVLGCS